MALEDSVRVLGLHHVEVAGERLEVLTELRVGDDSLQICVLTLVGVPLPRKQERQLLQSDWIFALGHDLANKLNIVHLLGDSHGVWVSLELSVDIERRSERVLHLLCIRGVVRAREQVVADSLIVVRVREVIQSTEPFDLEK